MFTVLVFVFASLNFHYSFIFFTFDLPISISSLRDIYTDNVAKSVHILGVLDTTSRTSEDECRCNEYQMIYFPETIIQWDTVPFMIILYNCCTMHNNTYSVHHRLLKLWRVSLLPQWPCCYVPSPPLYGANCRPFPFSGGPGPLVSKIAPLSPGFTHTPSPLSATLGSQMACQDLTKGHQVMQYLL